MAKKRLSVCGGARRRGRKPRGDDFRDLREGAVFEDVVAGAEAESALPVTGTIG